MVFMCFFTARQTYPKKLKVSGSSSEADSDLAVHGDDGGDTDILSSSNNSTCDSLSETEEGMYHLYTEYLIFIRLSSNLTNFNQKEFDGTSDNPCFITFRFVTARCQGDHHSCVLCNQI